MLIKDSLKTDKYLYFHYFIPRGKIKVEINLYVTTKRYPLIIVFKNFINVIQTSFLKISKNIIYIVVFYGKLFSLIDVESLK